MEPLSQRALLALVQAMDTYRSGVSEKSVEQKYTADERYEFEQYLVQLDLVMDELEEHYNACRKEYPDMLPFRELLRH